MEIGDRITIAREKRGWTKSKLALESGLSLPGISRYESGNQLPGADALYFLATALDVTSDWLLGLHNVGGPEK